MPFHWSRYFTRRTTFVVVSRESLLMQRLSVIAFELGRHEREMCVTIFICFSTFINLFFYNSSVWFITSRE